MASYQPSGAENFSFLQTKSPKRLGFVASSIHGKSNLKLGFVSFDGRRRGNFSSPRCGVSSSGPSFQPRFIQHKKEAFWFYRFLSIVYDHVINHAHWTEDIWDEALEPADLYDSRMKVVDVGGGTGFTTLAIIKHINPKNVTILDQSPHQLLRLGKRKL